MGYIQALALLKSNTRACANHRARQVTTRIEEKGNAARSALLARDWGQGLKRGREKKEAGMKSRLALAPGLREERDGTDHDPRDERKGCGCDCGH